MGEIQALRWEDIDFDRQVLLVHRSYARSENLIREYPKGRRQHSHRIPRELLAKLHVARLATDSEFVAAPPGCKMLEYSRYRRVLIKFCQEAGVRNIATHGLRHSSSEVWMEAGATRDDLRILFAHQDNKTTDRYVHDRGSRLSKVAEVLQLFPTTTQENVPRMFHGKETLETKKIADDLFVCDSNEIKNRGGGN